ncbi:MAG: macro domain-containing protein [Clostridiales bacterium]|nr:macro domain-containing protein [Clostridiales bacterium]
MPLTVVRNDITKVEADAVVNTANPKPVVGGGTDNAIYEAAGRDSLLKARKSIGDIYPGEAVYTSAFHLPAKYIIHTVGPEWVGGHHGEAAILRSCYENSLRIAKELGCKSIAFPLLATGVNGFPRDKAIDIATRTIYSFLENNDMEIILVIFDKESFKISGQRFADITAYIAQNYVADRLDEEYEIDMGSPYRNRRLQGLSMNEIAHVNRQKDMGDIHVYSVKMPETLEEYLKAGDMTFVEKLKEYIDASGKSASEIYDKEHMMTKQAYYKILKDKDYHPEKYTAIMFCLSLELSLEDSLDLLARAGWMLSKSRGADLIVRWHLANGIYSYRQLNDCLESMGYPRLEKIK